MRKLLDKYPVATIVILTLLVGIIAISTVATPKLIEESKIPVTNTNY